MKKRIRLIVFVIIIFISMDASAQLVGAGIQMAKGENVQFAMNMHTPYYKLKSDVNFFLFGGLEYTGGSTKLSGLNMKYISPTLDFAGLVLGDHADKGILWLACDAGYLFNFNKGKADGFVFTPNIMCSYSFLYFKAGYDMNVTRGNHQFFYRVGLILSI